MISNLLFQVLVDYIVMCSYNVSNIQFIYVNVFHSFSSSLCSVFYCLSLVTVYILSEWNKRLESWECYDERIQYNVYCWYTYINDMMPKDMIEMDKLSSCKTKKDIKSLKPVLKSELKNHYIKLFNLYIECLTEQNKLFL